MPTAVGTSACFVDRREPEPSGAAAPQGTIDVKIPEPVAIRTILLPVKYGNIYRSPIRKAGSGPSFDAEAAAIAGLEDLP